MKLIYLLLLLNLTLSSCQTKKNPIMSFGNAVNFEKAGQHDLACEQFLKLNLPKKSEYESLLISFHAMNNCPASKLSASGLKWKNALMTSAFQKAYEKRYRDFFHINLPISDEDNPLANITYFESISLKQDLGHLRYLYKRDEDEKSANDLSLFLGKKTLESMALQDFSMARTYALEGIYLSNQFKHYKLAHYLHAIECSKALTDDRLLLRLSDELLILYPKNPFVRSYVYWHKFWNYVRREHFDQAILLGHDSLNGPLTIMARYRQLFWLGEIYERTHQLQKAQTFFAKLASLDNDSLYVELARFRLGPQVSETILRPLGLLATLKKYNEEELLKEELAGLKVNTYLNVADVLSFTPTLFNSAFDEKFIKEIHHELLPLPLALTLLDHGTWDLERARRLYHQHQSNAFNFFYEWMTGRSPLKKNFGKSNFLVKYENLDDEKLRDEMYWAFNRLLFYRKMLTQGPYYFSIDSLENL